MKHKTEWKKLINMGQRESLTPAQLYFLIALREQEDGPEDNEFNIKAVRGYDEQALCAIRSIKENEKRWQRYILEQTYIDFPSFFVYHAGPYGSGWHTDKIKEIIDGFDSDSEMGEELGHDKDRREAEAQS